jgi:hypothetical protein
MDKNKDKKKKKVVESESTSDSGPEDVSIWIVNKHFFGGSIWRHSDLLMTGQSLQIQADVYVYMLPATHPSLQCVYVFCWEYDV